MKIKLSQFCPQSILLLEQGETINIAKKVLCYGNLTNICSYLFDINLEHRNEIILFFQRTFYFLKVMLFSALPSLTKLVLLKIQRINLYACIEFISYIHSGKITFLPIIWSLMFFRKKIKLKNYTPHQYLRSRAYASLNNENK